MKKAVLISLFYILSLPLFAGASREYQPSSDMEKQHYQRIDKNIWPDDVRKDIGKYRGSAVGWVGIVEKYMTDFTNREYNIIGFYVKHHYYDWIEDMGPQNKPISLSPDGEGYFVCYYLFRKEFDPKEIVKDFVGYAIINYGSPVRVAEDGSIELTTEYMRIIDKEHVNPNWLKYGRGGLGEKIMR
jgi:hypothetical protein